MTFHHSMADWEKFGHSVHAIAGLCKLRWDGEMVKEYTRPIIGKTTPEKALAALRRIYDTEGRMPGPTEIIAESHRPVEHKRWIIVQRKIVGKQAPYEFAREISQLADARLQVKLGELFVCEVGVEAPWEPIDKLALRKEVKKALGFDPEKTCPRSKNLSDYQRQSESIGDIFHRILFVNEKRDEIFGKEAIL